MKISTGLPDWTAAPAFCVHDAFAVNVTAPLLTTEASFVNTSSPLVSLIEPVPSTVKVPRFVVVVFKSWISAPATSASPLAPISRFARR